MKKKRLCFRLPRGMREKIEKVMKLFWILMCVFTFSVSAESLAQQERVSLNLKDVAVRALFDEIQRQTNLYFVFNTELTDRLGQLSVNVKDETVENVLDRVFQGKEYTYRVSGEQIIVVKRQEARKPIQEVVIEGTVLERDSMPIIGATIVLQ